LLHLPIAEGAKKRGISVVIRESVGAATVVARKNSHAALVKEVQTHYGVELPLGPWRASAHGVSFAGIAPETWLATCDGLGNDFARLLKKNLGMHASVCDQTDAYVRFDLSGTRVREVLSCLVPIDVHPRVFKVGRVAVTTAAHMVAILSRTDDGSDGCANFEIAVFRSYATSFWHALEAVLRRLVST